MIMKRCRQHQRQARRGTGAVDHRHSGEQENYQ
jgi:hypothetical protein